MEVVFKVGNWLIALLHVTGRFRGWFLIQIHM